MKIRKLDTANSNGVSFVENLYIESFPLSERRPVNKMLELYSGDAPFEIIVAIEDGELLGFLTYWDLGEFIFAEHFAISPEFRNGGYGGRVMKLFMENITKPIVLEVELPTTILSERRIGFYQRLGFRLWEDVLYQQPPYYEETGAIPMKLMSFGDIDIEKDFIAIKETLYSNVYGF
ncbi:GNAT family N-acetyltransferase [Dysgonomonas sp. 511]|uniref:GNAT family N-acetyltransferase n=1 Tax=Dysgonomonas sp. 511 TaxID=2302930 RepID=UPI0013D34326|nr:GNAT family N-acetyltransferase [Dysgonomonas sp. 511]NDV78334.1 N-acetyltransferase [Dysgonomonas sp. 511]